MGQHSTMNAKPYIPKSGRIIYSTEAKGLASHSRTLARQTPAQIKAADEIMSVVKAQPHRQGSDDPRLSDPLGQFCAAQWVPIWVDGRDANREHRDDMYRAGCQYGEIVHQHRVLMDLGDGGRTTPEGISCALTDEQRRANCDAARLKREAAEGILRNVHSRGVSAMTRLCVEGRDPLPTNENLSKACLWALAVHFGIQKLGINAEKTA